MPVSQSIVEIVLGECDVQPSDATFVQAITVATSIVESYLGFPLEGSATDEFYLDSEGFDFLKLPRSFTGIALVEDEVLSSIIDATLIASYGDEGKIRHKSSYFAAGRLRWKITVDTTVAINPVGENIVATLAARSIRQTQAISGTSGMAGFTQVALDGRSATVSESGSGDLISPITLTPLDRWALDTAYGTSRTRNVRL